MPFPARLDDSRIPYAMVAALFPVERNVVPQLDAGVIDMGGTMHVSDQMNHVTKIGRNRRIVELSVILQQPDGVLQFANGIAPGAAHLVRIVHTLVDRRHMPISRMLVAGRAAVIVHP